MLQGRGPQVHSLTLRIDTYLIVTCACHYLATTTVFLQRSASQSRCDHSILINFLHSHYNLHTTDTPQTTLRELNQDIILAYPSVLRNAVLLTSSNHVQFTTNDPCSINQILSR